MRALWLLALLALASCGEAASTWDDKRGRYVSTEEYKKERRDETRDLDRRLEKLEQKTH